MSRVFWRIKRYIYYWNDNKKYNFKVTPSFVVRNIDKVTKNQLMFNKNFESHVEAIKTLSSAVKELKEEIRRLKDARMEKR